MKLQALVPVYYGVTFKRVGLQGILSYGVYPSKKVFLTIVLYRLHVLTLTLILMLKLLG